MITNHYNYCHGKIHRKYFLQFTYKAVIGLTWTKTQIKIQ